MGRRLFWGVMTLLSAVVALYAFTIALVPTARTAFVQGLIDQKTLRTFGHLFGGGIALLAGAFQFNAALRNGRPAVHRLLGKVYLVSVLVGGIAGSLLAVTSSGGVIAHVGFELLALGWLGTSGVAYQRALEGEYDRHRDWMTRSYAFCLAAVTLRIYLPASLAAGVSFGTAYPVIAWMCWVPNVLVAEWMIASGRAPRVSAASTV
jgi:uncharacterized membrane protein